MQSSFKAFLEESFALLHPNSKFIDSWYIDILCECLTEIEKGNLKRVIVNIPPRCLKSFCISVAWPAWLLGKRPSCKIICVSYSQELSNKHSEDCNFLLSTQKYRECFPETVILKKHNRKNKYITSQHGFRVATSIGARLTGEGADIIILDDPQTPMQAASSLLRIRVNNWYQRTLISRLNNKADGAIVLVSQRLHQNDLTAFILENQSHNTKLISLPLISMQDAHLQVGNFSYFRKSGDILSPRFSLTDTANLKREMGVDAFEAQYQQNTERQSSTTIQFHWLQYFSLEEILDLMQKHGVNQEIAVYQSWDCAIKDGEANDYTVCTTWLVCREILYLLHLYRIKVNYPNLREIVQELRSIFKPNKILVEDHAAGQQIIQENCNQGTDCIIPVRPKYNKFIRASVSSSNFSDGNIKIPHNEEIAASIFHLAIENIYSSKQESIRKITYQKWIQDFISEITTFPNTRHDDIVDSTSQLILWLRTTNKKQERYPSIEIL